MSRSTAAGLAAIAGFVTACIFGGGTAFAFAERLPLTTGWYWALALATTAGSEVTPHGPGGRIVAVVVLLTAVPALGALFARLIAVHTAVWFHRNHGAALHAEAAAARRILADLHERLTGETHPDAPERTPPP